MPMRGNCTICTDYFGSEQDISVTFCGHLFHEPCLSQWLRQCGTRRTCPQCRTKLSAKQVVSKLYINVPETEDDDIDPFHLKNKLDEAESKLHKLKDERRKMKEIMKELESNKEKMKLSITSLKKNIKEEKNTSDFLQNELRMAKVLEKEAVTSQNEMKRMKERLKTCEKLEFILNGQKSQVDEMLQQYTSGNNIPPAVQQLATFCVALKQEYESLKASRNKTREELMRTKKDLHRSSQDLMQKTAQCEEVEETLNSLHKTEEQLNEENKGLRRKLEALQSAISSPSDTRASALSRLIAESPAPLLMTPDLYSCKKTSKRLSSEVEKCNLRNIIKKPRLSTSFNDEDVDLDACIGLDAGEGTSRDGSFIVPAPKAHKNVTTLKNSVILDSPDTLHTKKVCQEMGMKFVKTSSNTNFKSFRKPLGASNLVGNNPNMLGSSIRAGSYRLGGHSNHPLTARRVNKVPMSSKAKPFSAKPVLTSSLRAKMSNLNKKLGPR